MTKRVLMLSTLLVLGLAATAQAAGPGKGDAPFGLDFSTMDADKDGKLTEAELKAFRAARIAAADTDGDGLMSAPELSAMHLARMTERAEAMAARMVEELDGDGDGKLSAAEMAEGPMPARMFSRMDADDDGAITQAEADAARQKMAEHRGGRGHGPRGGWFDGMDD